MRFRDILWLGYKGLSEKRIRTILTILMVVIGVASIIALVSQTTGVQASITSSLETLGPTSIIVSPSFTTHLTAADVAKISTLPGVQTVIPIITQRTTMLTTGQPTSLGVIGVSSQGLKSLVGSVKLLSGSVYPDAQAPLALVGYNVAFPASNNEQQNVFVGHPIVLQQGTPQQTRTLTLSVAGLLQTYGSSPIIPLDDSIFVSLDSAAVMFHRVDYSMLLVKAADTSSVDSVSQLLTDIYGNSATVRTIQQITQTVSSVIGQIGILLGAIAGISLFVAAVGIVNVMLISVYERTREIGILKALGFKGRQVLMVFLSQAAFIGISGGLVGIGVGSGVSYLIPTILAAGLLGRGGGTASTRVASPGGGGGFGGEGGGFGGRGFGPSGPASLSYTPVITPEIFAISFAIAVIVSLLAGLYPAWRASRMQPITALRYQ